MATDREKTYSPRLALDALREIRTWLDNIAGVMPVGDAQMLVKSAAEKVAMAEDLIEAENV